MTHQAKHLTKSHCETPSVNHTDDNITRCPQCATAFRVTHDVLQVANGAVRCGSCLHVFNAPSHWQNNKTDQHQANEPHTQTGYSPQNPTEKKQEKPDSIVETVSKNTSFKNTPFNTPVDALEKEAPIQKAPAQKATGKNTVSDAITYNRLSISTIDQPTKKATNDPKENAANRHYESVSTEFSNSDSANDEPDESWALELLRESEAAEALLSNPVSEEESSHPLTTTNNTEDERFSVISASKIDNILDDAEHLFIDIINNDLQDSNDEPPINTLTDNITTKNNHSDTHITVLDDDDWAEDLLVDEYTDPSAAFILSETSSETINENGQDNPEPNGVLNSTLQSHTLNTPTKTDDTPPDSSTTKLVDSAIEEETIIKQLFTHEEPALNLQFERDAISFTEEKPKTRRWPWLAGSLLLATCIVAQIAWIQFDELSTRSPYRDYYAKACVILNCQVAKISDIGQIRSTHLVVRSHPDKKNALIVDAIIANNADFRQPFPGIKLIFLDIQGQAIASRVFQPKEYVKGELFGQTIMPARQSIQLSLSIIDPGDLAVNYRLEMVGPTTEY